MSALRPKADVCSALADVCLGPKADMRTTTLPIHSKTLVPVNRAYAAV